MRHGLQQPLIVLVVPHQDKSGWRCNQDTWCLIDLWATFPWVSHQEYNLANTSWGILATKVLLNIQGFTNFLPRFEEKLVNIRGFINFTAAHFCREISLFVNIPSLTFLPEIALLRDNRWRSEQRPIKNLKVFGWLLAKLAYSHTWPDCDETHSVPSLFYQSVYQYPCSAFRHS